VTRRTLADWLEYVERQHPSAIALGLERVAEARRAIGIDLGCPVVAVGGTNGKGSTSAMIASILGCAGYRVGLYTSPHLLRYNERVRLAGREAEDNALCEAFEAVERARGGIPLTYFEYGTLAAGWLFARERLEAVVLEVGLGGRLDAVNVFDADCAALTSVAIDHVDYLGNTREAIGREKAGIFRPGRPAVVADPAPPASVLESAQGIGAQLLLIGRDFGYAPQGPQWSYWGPGGKRHGLAHPRCAGRCSCATLRLRSRCSMRCAGRCRFPCRTCGAGWPRWRCRDDSSCCRDGRRSFWTLRTIPKQPRCSPKISP